MRHPFFPIPLAALMAALTAPPAAAQTPAPPAPVAVIPAAPVTAAPLSAEIGRDGIGQTLARLRSLPAPAPEDRFAIAGLEFLSGLERVYQWRTTYGIGPFGGLFFGAAAVLPGDQPVQPMPPASFADTLGEVLSAMDRSRTALAELPEGADFGLAIGLGDLWFDANGDGARSPGEGAAALWAGEVLPPGVAVDQDAAGLPVIRFDAADAAWLAAYGHLVSGISEVIRAFDPTPSIARVTEASAAIAARRAAGPQPQPGTLSYVDSFIDPLAILLDLLRHQPDPARTRAARDHWRATIAENRRFWTLVAAETDNAGEWIPNDAQVSATGIAFPPGTGAAWAGVLDDGEALLAGTRAIPFWRAPAGLDLAAWLENPAPLPLDGAIQGWAVLPYLTDKPPVSAESWRRFSDMLTETGPFLAMVMIN